jgi:hypothetical protein
VDDIPVFMSPELLKEVQADFEKDQRQWKWATRHAASRVFTVEEMYNFLGSAGDDARAEAWLPTLDEFTQTTAYSFRALQHTLTAMRLSNRPPTDENKETP